MKKAGEGNDDVETHMHHLAWAQLSTKFTMGFDKPARPRVVLFQDHVGFFTGEIMEDCVSPGYVRLAGLLCRLWHGVHEPYTQARWPWSFGHGSTNEWIFYVGITICGCLVT